MDSPILYVTFLVAVTILCNITDAAPPSKQKPLLKALYWEVKPFIFTNERGEIDGIIPRIYKRGDAVCNTNPNITVMDFVHKFTSRAAMNKTIFAKGIPAEVNGTKAKDMFLVPILKELDSSWEKANNIRSFTLMKTTEIVIIVPRSMIDLPNKILRGIMSCKIIFVIAFPLAILISIIVWFIEHFWNEDIDKSFVRGIGTTFYWSVVSMTTVGYGDVTPKAPLGRFVALFWLVVGVMLGCVMTATMTDVVSGIGSLSVYGERVAVLSDSYEQKVASRDYSAKTVPANSYEEVLDLVRQKKVYAAMMNADVAAWYQDEIRATDGKNKPLHIVDKVPAHLAVRCAMNQYPSAEIIKIFRCMHTVQEEVYEYTQKKYQRYCFTETIHIGSVSDLIHYNEYMQVLLATVCVLIAIGVVYDVFTFSRRFRSKRVAPINFHPKNLLDQMLGKQNGSMVDSRSSSTREEDEELELVKKILEEK